MSKRAVTIVAVALFALQGGVNAANVQSHVDQVTPQARNAASQIMASFSFSCITFQVGGNAPSVQFTNNGPAVVPAGTKLHWIVKQSSGDYVVPQPIPVHYITVLNGVARSGLGDCSISVVQ
jgi:hypothetical protein